MPQSEEEQQRTYVTHGPVWVFRMDGNAYTSDYDVDEWQWPEEVA